MHRQGSTLALLYLYAGLEMYWYVACGGIDYGIDYGIYSNTQLYYMCSYLLTNLFMASSALYWPVFMQLP